MPTANQLTELPSFSIIYETENLSSVELENIYRSLASLAKQEISPEQANEFLIIDGGNAPPEVIKELCGKYPWITVSLEPGIGYHEAKMKGATLATGEIVIFCDSDCVYTPNWLKDILTTFQQNSEINVLAGEASTPIRNPYELALALHYFFSRFSGNEQPYISQHYCLNGVAFHRDFLLKNPLPINLPLYRSNCNIHLYSLCELKKYQVWKHPQARAVHEPPTPAFIFWRYLLLGHDAVLRRRIKRLIREMQNSGPSSQSQFSAQSSSSLETTNRSLAVKLWEGLTWRWRLVTGTLGERIAAIWRENPRSLLFLPLAIPIVIWFELLYNIGCIITYWNPDYLLKAYFNYAGIDYPGTQKTWEFWRKQPTFTT